MSDERIQLNLNELSTTFTLENRFERDFEIIKKIGTGGFASVYKVRNLLDESEYAVKKIVLKIDNKSTKRIKSEIENVMSEIRCLARIKNENVVRYNHSWIEVKLKENEKCEEDLFSKDQISDQDEEAEDSFALSFYEWEVKDNLEFLEHNFNCGTKCTCNFSKRNDDSISSDNTYVNLGDKKNPKKFRSLEVEKIKINGKSYSLKQIKKIKIYIQMELCKETLGDILINRKSFVEMKNEEFVELLKIFKNITETVDYLHTKEQIIHRDLKPKNIFFSEDSKVKIGDFGLATELFNLKYKKISIDSSDFIMSRRNSESSTIESSPNEVFSLNLSYHTKNVGTLQYASPEQLNNNFYDNKTDIFSLGLILFELVYPLNTGMQRHQVLKELKEQRILPENFSLKFPNLSNLIIKMVDISPSRRPDAKEILEVLNQEIKNLLKRKTLNKKLTLNSEDIVLSNSYELELQIEDENNQNNFTKFIIKIIDHKLLILPNNKSIKAQFIYDLNECEINITEGLVEINHPFMNRIFIKASNDNMRVHDFCIKIKNYLYKTLNH